MAARKMVSRRLTAAAAERPSSSYALSGHIRNAAGVPGSKRIFGEKIREENVDDGDRKFVGGKCIVRHSVSGSFQLFQTKKGEFDVCCTGFEIRLFFRGN